MTEAGISFAELLRSSAEENRRWREWFAQQPAALEVPIGEAGGPTASLGGMLRHIFLTELFYAELLNEKKNATDYARVPASSLEELFAIADSAHQEFHSFLSRAGDDELETVLKLTRGDFSIAGTKRKMLAHVLLHSQRHWAQIATALRQQGYKPGWQHDLLFSQALQ